MPDDREPAKEAAMKIPALLSALAVLTACIGAAPVSAEPTVVVSPQPLPIDNDRPRVFLGGSIDMGGAPDWQAALTQALSDKWTN